MSAAPLPWPPPRRSQLRVQVVSEVSDLAALEAAWGDLLERSRIDHPFLTYDWIRTWWDAFGAGRRLQILTVKDGERLVGLAPLMLAAGRLLGLRVRLVESIANSHTPRFDFVLAERAEESLEALWRFLLERRAEWDVLQLRQLPQGSATLAALGRLAAGEGFLVGHWGSDVSPYLPLRGSWDAYLASLSRKHRSNLRNRGRRLASLGPTGRERIADGAWEPALAEGLRIEAAAWKGRSGTAIASRPDTLRFYSELAARAARRGWLRLTLLRAGDAYIAFDYSLRYADRLYLLKTGYDPRYAAYSPFNALCQLELREAFGDGTLEYDFLGGLEPWKQAWGCELRPHYWLFVMSDRPLLRLLHRAKFRLLPRLQRGPLYRALRSAVARLSPGDGV